MSKRVLVTGGLWYIWGHIVVRLEALWIKTIIIDDLSNSSFSNLANLESIVAHSIEFRQGSITDSHFLESVFQEFQIDAVIHLAGKKSVSESISSPFDYYKVNVWWSLELFAVMDTYNVRKCIFSSTAWVYDSENLTPPFAEDDRKKVIHPYAHSKLVVEGVLEQMAIQKRISSISLRYFNVIWAHTSGVIGDSYFHGEVNVLGYMIRTLFQKQDIFHIYGDAFSTSDGTAVRDYIDVNDLVEAHIKALEYVSTQEWYMSLPLNVWNGGEGTTVKTLLMDLEKISEKKISYDILSPRMGDVWVSVAHTWKIQEVLSWSPKISLRESLEMTWKFLQNNVK